MKKKNELKEIDIKNGTCYYFELMILIFMIFVGRKII